MQIAVLLALPNHEVIFGYEGGVSDALRPMGLQLLPKHPGTQDVRLGSEYTITVPDQATADQAVALLRAQRGIEKIEILN